MNLDNLRGPELQEMLEELEERLAYDTFHATCEIVGVGILDLQGRGRSGDLVRRRAVVAWILADRIGWKQAQVAQFLRRTKRQIQFMLRKERVTSPSRRSN